MSRLVEDGVITPNTLPCEYFDMIAGTSTGGYEYCPAAFTATVFGSDFLLS
jgi:hypothetical protein